METEIEVTEQKLTDLRQKVRLIDIKLATPAVRMSPDICNELRKKRSIYYKEISNIKNSILELRNTGNTSDANQLINTVLSIRNEPNLFSYEWSQKKLIKNRCESLRNKLFNIGRRTNTLNETEKANVKQHISAALLAINDWEKRYLQTLESTKEKARQKQREQESLRTINKRKTEKVSVALKPLQTKSAVTQENSIQQQSEYSIRWTDVKFRNGFINVSCNGKSVRVHCDRSLQQFNFLKDSINLFGNQTLTIKYNPITDNYKIDSEEMIGRVFDRLEIEQLLTNVDIQNPDYFIKTFLGHLNNRRLLQAYRPEGRTLYLNYLCGKYSDSFCIVPVKEKRKNESNRSIISEDAFLFPIYNRQWVYISWESVEDKRATYIFRCRPENYAKAVQKVFDYIASPDVTNKRDRLRQGDVGYFKGTIVEYYKSLNHDDLSDWKRRLNEICE